MVHFDGLDFGADGSGGEVDDHAGTDDTGFDTTDGDGSDTTNLVDVLEGETEGLLGGTCGGFDGVDGLEEGAAVLGAGSADNFASLEPGHVGGDLQHVVTVPSGEGDHGDLVGLVPNLLQELLHLADNFLVAVFGPLHSVHLVDGDDELLDSEGVGEEGVFVGLAVLADAGFELTTSGGDGQDGAIGLRGSSNHVLDEVAVTGSINDSDVELGGFKLLQGSVNGDTTFTFGLQVVQDPGVLEGALAELIGFLLKLLNGALVNTSALVDQMSGGRGFTRVDVANNDNGNVELIFTHDGWL